MNGTAMFMKIRKLLALAAVLLSTLNFQLSTALAQGTAFTYQGVLKDGANPASGNYDLLFTLYDSTNHPGTIIAGPLTNAATAVSNGLFTVTLDFGAGVFTGAGRWLEIGVRTGGDPFAALSPRQAISSVPYAAYAMTPAGPQGPQGIQGVAGPVGAPGPQGAIGPTGATGPVGAKGDKGDKGDIGLTGATGATGPPGAQGLMGPQGLIGQTGAAGATGPAGAKGDQGDKGDKGDSGPAGAAGPQGSQGPPGTSGSANGWNRTGDAGTTAGTDFLGTTDNQPLELKVNNQRGLRLENGTNFFATGVNVIGGHSGNVVADGAVGATIAGGGANQLGSQLTNTVTASYATIGGGTLNGAGGLNATVAGGTLNGAGGESSSIGGGSGNQATGLYATIPGGFNNVAAGYAFAGGNRAKANHVGAFVWADSSTADFTSTANNQFNVRAAGGVRFVTGGPGLTADGTVTATSFVGDGSGLTGILSRSGGNTLSGNQIVTSGNVGIGSLAPGFPLNFANALGDKIALFGNVAGQPSFGFGIQASLLQIHTSDVGSDVAFGYGTSAAMTETMRIKGNGNVGIGTSTPGNKLSVVGGADFLNSILVSGNADPSIRLSANGTTELALGVASVPGNYSSSAAVNDTVIRNSSARLHLQSGTGAAAVTIDTANNVGIGTTTPSTKLDVAGEVTMTACNITSDRNAKEQFKPVNARDVLSKVVGLPISEWQYKTQTGARHIGPMAQDFHEAFALGRDEKHIATVDADGVALAAIQGLNEVVREQRESIEKLEARNRDLEIRLAGRLAVLEKRMEQSQRQERP